MTAVALSESLLKIFGRLERAGGVVFKTRAASDDALKVLKSSSNLLVTNEGSHGLITNSLIQSLLKRTVIKARGTAGDAFRIVVDAGDKTTLDIGDIMRDIRLGKVTDLLDKFKVPPESVFRQPRFVNHLKRTFQNLYPDVALNKLSKRLREIHEVPPRLFKKPFDGSVDDLHRVISADEQAARLVDAMEKSLKKKRPIMTKGIFFSFTLTTGGSAAIYAAMCEAAERSTGCWRIYRDKQTGELKSCKVRYASCSVKTDGDGGMPNDRYCQHYPSVINETSCANEWSERTPCVRCDPAGVGTDRLEIENYVDPADIYVCRPRPSLGEMLGQIVLDAPHILSEAAVGVVDRAESIFSRIWNAVKSFGIWVVVMGLLLLAASTWYYREQRAGKGGSDRTPLIDNMEGETYKKRGRLTADDD